MANKIPTFENYPLDETVIGLQFEPLKQFGLQHLLLFWLRIKDRYPRLEDQAPLPHTVEQAGMSPQQALLSVQSKIPPPRCWFLDHTGNELVQVQHDKFLRNWRLLKGNERYPRFDQLFSVFWQEWQGFQAFLREENIGFPKVDQCELTYVNYIEAEQIQGGLGGLDNVFTVLCKQERQRFLPTPEVFSWQSAYPLADGRSRLHVAVSPNFRQRDFKLVVNFTLTARGAPADPSESQIRAWFDLAHEWIVRAFDELTTPKMHEIWRKVHD